jgi:uncharacterized membrane protein
MTAFTVWKFDTPEGAQHAATMLEGAADDQLVKILDYAVVSWPVGATKPKLDEAHKEKKKGAAWGSLWGLLFGLLFTVPVLGVAVGAAVGALSKATSEFGIGESDLQRIRDEVTEGTSALFTITDEGNLDRLGERFRGFQGHLVQTNLTEAERATLLETFGQD